MSRLVTATSSKATKVLLCGSGELGKEVAIELQRLGVEVIALDRYDNAPAMQVAHRSYTLSMLDGPALKQIVEQEKPDYIVPEIEAIATDTLLELEQDGYCVIPNAKATQLTMNREGIRRLAAETLKLKTSPYQFADSKESYLDAIMAIGFPCLVKPIMSSSGKGQSILRSSEGVEAAWAYAQTGGRAGQGKVIIEGFVEFDYEITLLTVRHKKGTSYCQPIGHLQQDGDYYCSWQPQAMSAVALANAQKVAKKITDALGGYGIFGVELFIKDDDVFFSEVSPRPHDTGLVTLISQELSEFALHARAILGLPVPHIEQYGPSASHVILAQGQSRDIAFSNLEYALEQPNTDIRLFGKPEIEGRRRLGVALARAHTIEQAIHRATNSADAVVVELE